MTAAIIPFPSRTERGERERMDAEIERQLSGTRDILVRQAKRRAHNAWSSGIEINRCIQRAIDYARHEPEPPFAA